MGNPNVVSTFGPGFTGLYGHETEANPNTVVRSDSPRAVGKNNDRVTGGASLGVSDLSTPPRAGRPHGAHDGRPIMLNGVLRTRFRRLPPPSPWQREMTRSAPSPRPARTACRWVAGHGQGSRWGFEASRHGGRGVIAPHGIPSRGPAGGSPEAPAWAWLRHGSGLGRWSADFGPPPPSPPGPAT